MSKFKNKSSSFYIRVLISISALLLVSIVGFFGYIYLNRTCEDCNVILISIDTLRTDHMSAYGYAKKTTPTIDSLSKKSLVFTDFRTQVPATYPSFTSLMTGISPFDSGVFNNSYVQEMPNPAGGKAVPENYKTLAEVLKSRGYVTKAYMTNFQLQKSLTNISQGFDNYEYINTYKKLNELRYEDIDSYTKKLKQSRKEYKAFINQSTNWIATNKKNKFFLWIHLMDPHTPYMLLSDDYECLFATPEQCKTIRKEGLKKLEELRKKLEGCPDDKATQDEITLFESLYDSSIYQADQYVNSILQSVLKNKLGNKTMVIIYGDHGEGFDHDFNFAHGHALYDSSLRMPVIIRYPHIQNNITIDRLGTNSNLFDLILYFLNAKNITKNKIDAQLFSKVDPVFYATNTGMTKLSIINSDYKYIYSMLGTCIYEPEENFSPHLNVLPNFMQTRLNGASELTYNPFSVTKFSPIPKLPQESYPKQWEEIYQIKHDPYETNNLIYNFPQSTIPIRLFLYYYLNSKKLIQPEHISTTDKSHATDELDQIRSLGY